MHQTLVTETGETIDDSKGVGPNRHTDYRKETIEEVDITVRSVTVNVGLWRYRINSLQKSRWFRQRVG